MKLCDYVVHSVVKETMPARVKLAGGEELDVLVPVATVEFVPVKKGHGTLKFKFPAKDFAYKIGDVVEVVITAKTKGA